MVEPNKLTKWGMSLDEDNSTAFDVVDRVLRPIEWITKKPLFGCHMCGQCVLHSTGLVCPMGCPKQMRNGPCGGVGPDGTCEVMPERKCIWYRAVKSAERLPWKEEIYQINPPVDRLLEGSSSWVNAFTGRDHHNRTSRPWQELELTPKHERPIVSGSRWERTLRAGHFGLQGGLMPPAGVSREQIIEWVNSWGKRVDVIEVADNGYALQHMSNVAAASVVLELGYDVMLGTSCRDRSRLMLQSDILGASLLGVRNFLCLTGDHSALNGRESKPVFDLDAVTLIDMLRKMRDDGILSADEIMEESMRPKAFIGGVVAPDAPPREYRPHRLAKKVAAGLDYVVTQEINDVDMFENFMMRVRDLGLHDYVYIIAGLGILDSAAMAHWAHNNIPGVNIPERVIKRLESVPESKQREEGLKMAIENLQRIKEIPGVSGAALMIHISLTEWDPIDELLEATGLSERPKLEDLEAWPA